MPRQSYGIGLIGAGRIGAKRAAALPTNCRLNAVHDIEHKTAVDLAEHFPGAEVVNSARDVCSRDDVDAVIIATTHDALALLALIAIQHGKHVFIEKPGARNPRELQQVAEAAELQGVVIGVGFNHRFHPAIRATHQLINSLKYGSLLWMRGRYGHGGRVGYEHEWRAVKEISGGGELMDQGCHLIDLTHHLLGPTTVDYAHLTTSFWDMPVEDNAFLSLTTASGAIAWLHVSWTEWKNTFSLEVTLEKAKIEISGLGGSYGTEVLTLYEMLPEMGPPITTRQEFPSPTDESWHDELEDFIARVEGAAGIGCDVTQAITVHEIIAEAYRR